jgi:hypothetical protein
VIEDTGPSRSTRRSRRDTRRDRSGAPAPSCSNLSGFRARLSCFPVGRLTATRR